jgi:hypothetical protein
MKKAMKWKAALYFGLVIWLIGGAKAQDVCLRDATIPQVSPVVSVFGKTVLVAYVELTGPFRTVISRSLSTDGGETFSYLGPLPSCPTCSQGMPALTVNEDGVFFLANIDDQTYVLSSSDGGKTFVQVSSLDQNLHLLYPHILCDRSDFYLVGTDLLAGKILLAKSGLPAPVAVTSEGNPVFGRIALLHGNLYCLWLRWPWPLTNGLILPFGIPDSLAGLGPDLLAQFCRAYPATLWISVSQDGGQNWSSPRSLGEVKLPWHVEQHDSIAFASFVSGGLEVPLAPAILADSRKGYIYIAFPSARKDGSLDVQFMVLDPQLNVISPPHPLAKSTVQRERFLPAMAISPEGVLGLAFYELDPLAKTINVVFAQSSDGGQTFYFEQVNSSPMPIPPVAGQPTRSGHFEPSFFSGYIGDSLGIAADEDFFYLAWVDFRNIIITPDYPEGRSDFDIYFRKLQIQR